MSVEGLCQICQSNAVDSGCDRCGQLVCSTHYDEATGICTQCIAETGGRPAGEDEGSQPKRPDGADEHRF